jgi:outer membrane protein assembly factor BamA
MLVFALASLGRGVSPAAAQEPHEETPRNVFIPIPVLFYTPETHLAFGGAPSYIYRAPGSSVDDRPSSFNGMIIVTTRSQVLASAGANHYWDAERQQATGGVLYRKFPDEFFGIGNDTPDESESYTDEGSAVALDYLVRIFPRLRAGAGVVYGTSSITETKSDDLLASGVVPGSNGGQVAGAGLRANFDSRDNITYPKHGGFYDLSWLVYGSTLGGDFDLNRVALDLRHYLSLGERNLIALRALGSSTGGSVPFQLMPALGGQNLMRGYFAGRFRDRKAVAAQGELRSALWRRFGGVLFASLGQVATRGEQIAVNRLHHAYGFGVRVLLVRQEGLNLRLDWGFGKDQSGFYFSLGEAF